MRDPFSLAASAEPYTIYYHEAMREPDRDEFEKAMVKEFNDHYDAGKSLRLKMFPRLRRSLMPFGR